MIYHQVRVNYFTKITKNFKYFCFGYIIWQIANKEFQALLLETMIGKNLCRQRLCKETARR